MRPSALTVCMMAYCQDGVKVAPLRRAMRKRADLGPPPGMRNWLSTK